MKTSLENLIEECKNPSAQWRGMPFWALNGKLEPDEIRRQIREFKKNGLGGFFLHARTGLATPYLSEEFFEAISAAIDEAEKRDMLPYLYDEDRFPSGSGGGILTADVKHRAKGIFLEELNSQQAKNYILPDTVIAVFIAKTDGFNAVYAKRVADDSWRNIREDEIVAVFYTDTIKCSSWYNNYTYGDTLSADTADKFIELTHEAYKKHYNDKFGKLIPGIFTDEPRYGFVLNQPEWDCEKRFAMPWTPGLLEYIQKRYGYDITDRLFELFYQLENADSTAPRIHYIETMMKFFLDGFIGKCSTWCRENNLMLTGHTVGEDSLSYQTSCCGSAMRIYEYMDMPGMDLLTEHHRAYATAKQVSSAAHQFNRKRRLSESYGCTGYDFPILGFCALGDWQYALGINSRCQHLAFYTTEGETKRDYPCTVANHSNTPHNFKDMEDRFARLSVCLAEGEEKRNILLISPIESAWSLYHCNWRKEQKTKDFDTKFNMLSLTLLANQLDFDYGDEDIISRHGKIEKNGSEVFFCVGHAKYKTVVLPQMITIRSSTLDLLRQFKQLGGRIIASDSTPTHIDGYRQEIKDCPWNTFSSADELVDALEEFREFSVRDKADKRCKSLLHQIRVCEGYDILFVCNAGHDADKDEEDGAEYTECGVFERTQTYPDAYMSIVSSKNGEVIEFDFENGQYYHCKAQYIDGKWHFASSFDRLQSRLFIITANKNEIQCTEKSETLCQRNEVITVSHDDWEYNLSEMNTAVFDRFYSNVSDKKEYILELDALFRKKFNLAERHGIMAQPWCRKKDNINSGIAEFYTDFECRSEISGPISVIMENPDLYELSVNGMNIELKDIGYWHEKAWRKIQILTPCLKIGKNRITLKTKINDSHSGLEAIFLTGAFSVFEEDDTIILDHLPYKLKNGDWCRQGFTFYNGNITYSSEVKLKTACKGIIRLENFYGTPAEIYVNDEKVDTLFYSPAESRVLDLPEQFTLKIVITGSLRNSCGPFFCQTAQPVWCGPAQFNDYSSPIRKLLPYGICGDVKIII